MARCDTIVKSVLMRVLIQVTDASKVSDGLLSA